MATREQYRSLGGRTARVTTRHVRILLVAAIGAVAVGTAGFVVLEGWSVEDALYQTVTTLTTVGFREVHELDSAGRAWAMVVAIAGVAIIFGSIGIVSEYLVDEVASGRREARSMMRAVEATRDHFILCGYGRVGAAVARELSHAGQTVVVIDTDDGSREQASAEGHLAVPGDATDDATLETAGVGRARGLVACVDSDSENVFIVLSARQLNGELFIVARANTADSEAKLLRAGANRVVSPYGTAGRRIAELAIRPRVIDFIDAALSHGELTFSIEELPVAEGSWLAGKTVGELRDRGVFTLAVFLGEERHEAHPADDRAFAPGESIVVTGPTAELRTVSQQA
ncbi:MAG TPA: potassium channel protein [Candidatus Limnocylindria bacterium]|nr:potassium channel protein [Candidatus Limnocylindria bacterium]